MKNLFANYKLPELKKSASERISVMADIMVEYDKSSNKKSQTMRNLNFFARYIKTKDLYPLLSQMKQSRNPAALFWSIVKPVDKKLAPPK